MVSMEKINWHGCNEKGMKENDEDDADGMKQEVDSKDKVMHIAISDL